MILKNTVSEPLDIIILAGQSNMEGNGLGKTEFLYEKDDDILMMQCDIATEVKKNAEGREFLHATPSEEYFIEPAEERKNSDGEPCGILALSFAALYKENNLEKGRKLLLVQTAVGGTGFRGGHWGLEDVLYKRLFEMTDAALSMNKENRIVAVLWHQGEHDAYENAGLGDKYIKDFYSKRFSLLVSGIREKYGEELPFIAAGFTHGWMDKYPIENKAVIDASVDVLSTLGCASYITKTLDLASNEDSVGNGDTVHFSKDALYTLGNRYYEEYVSLLK